MALTISRIDRVEREYDVTATNPDGTPANPNALDFAVVPPRTPIDGDTTWTTFPVAAGVVTVVYAAPDADDLTDALVIPAGGCDVHAREVNGSFVTSTKVERITVA